MRSFCFVLKLRSVLHLIILKHQCIVTLYALLERVLVSKNKIDDRKKKLMYPLINGTATILSLWKEFSSFIQIHSHYFKCLKIKLQPNKIRRHENPCYQLKMEKNGNFSKWIKTIEIFLLQIVLLHCHFQWLKLICNALWTLFVQQ